MPDAPTITLDGNAFTDDEQHVLATIWARALYGAAPSFNESKEEEMKVVADGLLKRGLLYRVTGVLPHGADPDTAGYALNGKTADWVAEIIFDTLGHHAGVYQ